MLSGQFYSLDGLSPMKVPGIPNKHEVGLAPYPDAMGKTRTFCLSGLKNKDLQAFLMFC
jgi:hypothetical protein